MKIKNRNIIGKIISFTQKDGIDWDCNVITDRGEHIIVDPYVGCSWDYNDRQHLLGMWFSSNAHLHAESGVWLTDDKTFKLLPNKQ